jgi:ubiquinone/menaquinone biosynthesis C-methylase UbiE
MGARYATGTVTGASRGAARYPGASMADFALPPNDEPFDFRHQAAIYGRFRRDYSDALYDAIGEHTGAGEGRLALDVGCGTGFVTASLDRRGWRTVGVDFSAPMLAQARSTSRGTPRLARARGESLPVRDASAALVTCGTSFHWLAPAPALAEFTRVLAPGGRVALFWRYAAPGEPSSRLVTELLREMEVWVADGFDQLRVHASEPFAGSALAAEATRTFETTVGFTAEEFHGYVSTLEWVRRFAGPRHREFLERLREALAARHPEGFAERTEEYLFLARKPG